LIFTTFLNNHPTYSEEKWKQFATFKSGINFFQYFISKEFELKAKIWKIRYEAILSNPEKRGYFQIGCYRSHGDKTCFEDILPRQDCVYWLYEEEIIYGWESGYIEYYITVISENMDWTVTLFEYTDYEKKPETTRVTGELITPLLKNKCKGDDKNKEITEKFEVTPENGILGIRIKKVEPLFPEDKSLSLDCYYRFKINMNPTVDYPMGAQKGYIIHTDKKATISLIVTIKNCRVTYEIYHPSSIENRWD
jgi:hypothetical protein